MGLLDDRLISKKWVGEFYYRQLAWQDHRDTWKQLPTLSPSPAQNLSFWSAYHFLGVSSESTSLKHAFCKALHFWYEDIKRWKLHHACGLLLNNLIDQNLNFISHMSLYGFGFQLLNLCHFPVEHRTFLYFHLVFPSSISISWKHLYATINYLHMLFCLIVSWLYDLCYSSQDRHQYILTLDGNANPMLTCVDEIPDFCSW